MTIRWGFSLITFTLIIACAPFLAAAGTESEGASAAIERFYCPNVTQDLQRNDCDSGIASPSCTRTRSNEVSDLQKFLMSYFPESTRLVVSGKFLTETRNAVVQFQLDERIIAKRADGGRVGPLTRARIKDLACTTSNVYEVNNATPAQRCMPLSPQTQTLSCSSGQTGSITQTRSSICAPGATTPTWSAWSNINNTCQTSITTNSTTNTSNSTIPTNVPPPTNLDAAVPTAQIKNLMIFQVGGWTGIIRDVPGGDFEWPAYGGKSAYIARSADILDHQMQLIKGLGDSVALSVLLMDESDATASGYGACWNGSWNGEIASCTTGTYTKPYAMYDNMRAAAQRAGVRYAPEFSIMNYAHQGQGSYVLPALQSAISWWRTRLPDANAAKAPDGRYYVVIDGLPSLAGLTAAQKTALIAYMKSQSDIYWVDNLVNDDANPATYTGNIVRSAAAGDGARSALKSILGTRYKWWFSTNTVARTFTEFNSVANKTPDSVREKWLNINPSDPSGYPVGISQWNEYAEYLIFEPSTRSGSTNYNYLKWMLSRQP